MQFKNLQLFSFASFFKYLKRVTRDCPIWAKLFIEHQAYLCQLTYPPPLHAQSAFSLLMNRRQGDQSSGGFRELGACKEETALCPFWYSII